MHVTYIVLFLACCGARREGIESAGGLEACQLEVSNRDLDVKTFDNDASGNDEVFSFTQLVPVGANLAKKKTHRGKVAWVKLDPSITSDVGMGHLSNLTEVSSSVGDPTTTPIQKAGDVQLTSLHPGANIKEDVVGGKVTQGIAGIKPSLLDSLSNASGGAVDPKAPKALLQMSKKMTSTVLALIRATGERMKRTVVAVTIRRVVALSILFVFLVLVVLAVLYVHLIRRACEKDDFQEVKSPLSSARDVWWSHPRIGFRRAPSMPQRVHSSDHVVGGNKELSASKRSSDDDDSDSDSDSELQHGRSQAEIAVKGQIFVAPLGFVRCVGKSFEFMPKDVVIVDADSQRVRNSCEHSSVTWSNKKAAYLGREGTVKGLDWIGSGVRVLFPDGHWWSFPPEALFVNTALISSNRKAQLC